MGAGEGNPEDFREHCKDLAEKRKRKMAAHGIACYSVGCEPALGSYLFARDFMCTLAEITGGQAVALDSAALLAEVIVNGSAEEISMTLLQREVEQEIEFV